MTLSTNSVTKAHVEKMVSDAKTVAGCGAKCTVSLVGTVRNDSEFWDITHYAGNRKDSMNMSADAIPLMQENAIANFLLAMHETVRGEEKANRELAAEVRKVRAEMKKAEKPSTIEGLSEV